MEAIREWVDTHPNIWEFILFNLLSNCATITNFAVMWICTGWVFSPLKTQPFQLLFFHYTKVESDLGLCGFLSFLTATAAAQTVNFFVQKNLVFKANVRFSKSIPLYILLAVVLVVLSAALPAYTQSLLVRIGIPMGIVPTAANIINILMQVAVSYPAMKFLIMRK